MLFNKVLIAQNGQEALELLEENHIDIIISDITMPKMNGIEMAKKIRESDNKISIIFLTAHTESDFLLEASNLQVDGFLIKPIDLSKIKTALSNSIKRNNFSNKILFSNGSTYDTHNSELTLNNESILLGNKEHHLLDFLINHQNKVLTKEEIEIYIWPYLDSSENALKNLVYNLRKKIGKDSIESVPGYGYKLIIN